MDIEFDPAKRDATLIERGLDMAEAGRVFDGPHLTFEDDRFPYGETRLTTIGHLDGRMVAFTWTRRGTACRVISMRKCNVREQALYGSRLG
ncbi:MAG: hypothetical protein BWX69_03063 [Planctomycetes bacterium ADurb.Bin069]|nr:MAG: hypothetical protein BWX69_03063 [Planctomycetes bacterium ADurb.Bin069]